MDYEWTGTYHQYRSRGNGANPKAVINELKGQVTQYAAGSGVFSGIQWYAVVWLDNDQPLYDNPNYDPFTESPDPIWPETIHSDKLNDEPTSLSGANWQRYSSSSSVWKRAFKKNASDSGKRCVIYILRCKSTVLEEWEEVELYKKITVDWVDKTTSEMLVDGLGISTNADNSMVYLRTDTANSTSDYDSRINIPTSEFLKTYAKTKKYENEYEIYKITHHWKLTVNFKAIHYQTEECLEYDSEGRHRGDIHEGVVTDDLGPFSAERSTVYFVMRNADTYVPEDVTLFNSTLGDTGKVTMDCEHDTWNNDSLGFFRIASAQYHAPKINWNVFRDFTKEVGSENTYVMRLHHGNGTCCKTSKCYKHTPARLQSLVERAMGKKTLYVSSNEAWLFRDGEGHTYVLSNTQKLMNNLKSKNFIKDPPPAGYTRAEGDIMLLTGTPDRTKTYSEGCSFATGISEDNFYKDAIPILVNFQANRWSFDNGHSFDGENGLYKSRAKVHWTLRRSNDPKNPATKQLGFVSRSNDNVYVVEAEDDNIFTPVFSNSYLVTDPSLVQKIDQVPGTNVVMDTTFIVHSDCNGVAAEYPGYGNQNYERYLYKNALDDIVTHVVQAKFPFPVIRQYMSGGKTYSRYYPSQTWIELPVGDVKLIASYFEDELESQKVYFRSIAENVMVDTAITYKAPGTAFTSDMVAELVDDPDEDYIVRVKDPFKALPYYTRDSGKYFPEYYVAGSDEDVNLYGRIYGFRIIDQTDYPTWERVFRNADDTLNVVERHTVNNADGVLDRTGFVAGTRNQNAVKGIYEPTATLPTVKGQNPFYPEAGALTPGYAIKYTFETVGDFEGEGDYVAITPKFNWINEDGSVIENVSVYYKEPS